jgi:hypothetical protein
MGPVASLEASAGDVAEGGVNWPVIYRTTRAMALKTLDGPMKHSGHGKRPEQQTCQYC